MSSYEFLFRSGKKLLDAADSLSRSEFEKPEQTSKEDRLSGAHPEHPDALLASARRLLSDPSTPCPRATRCP